MTAHDVPVARSWAVIDCHRPPLQLGCFALSVTCWAHHDFTDQTVLPGEIRTSEEAQDRTQKAQERLHNWVFLGAMCYLVLMALYKFASKSSKGLVPAAHDQFL